MQIMMMQLYMNAFTTFGELEMPQNAFTRFLYNSTGTTAEEILTVGIYLQSK
jgi:hypothetical protein